MPDPSRWHLQYRSLVEVCTDPQRRCYNGASASSEMRWTEWKTLLSAWGSRTKEDLENSLKTYQQINPKDEYRVIWIEEPAA